MKNLFLGVILGLLLGYFIFSETKNNKKNMKANREVSSFDTQNDEKLAEIPNLKLAIENKKISNEVRNINDKNPLENELKPSMPSESIVSQNGPDIINIDFDENQIEEIEQRMTELQGEIAFFKDNKGWFVHMSTDSNPFTEIGIKNNDFIRFEQVENMKMNSRNSNLALRLEDIIRKLER